MAESDIQNENPAARRAVQSTSLVLTCVASLALGAAGYMAVGTGQIPGLSGRTGAISTTAAGKNLQTTTVFLALDPFMVTIPRTDPVRQLRLELQLEIPEGAEAKVRALSPRIEDTMNTYLRSIDLSGIEDPDNLLRMRMQLLRRLQVAAGDGLINDLLVTQFLIS